MLLKKEILVKEDIKKTLKSLDFKPSLSADIWSDSGMQHAYLGVTLHFVNSKKLNLCRIFLGLKELKESHIGDLILFETESLLSEYDTNLHNISRIVTDNAANIKKAYNFNILYNEDDIWEQEIEEIFPVETPPLIFPMHLSCFAHSLQLSLMSFIKEFLSNTEGFKNLCKLIGKVKKSVKATQLLQESSNKTLINPSLTRWASWI